MNIRSIKNILATLGYISTILCVVIAPDLADWYIVLYIIYSVAIGIGHDDEDHN